VVVGSEDGVVEERIVGTQQCRGGRRRGVEWGSLWLRISVAGVWSIRSHGEEPGV
jgi:hypothetical protein